MTNVWTSDGSIFFKNSSNKVSLFRSQTWHYRIMETSWVQIIFVCCSSFTHIFWEIRFRIFTLIFNMVFLAGHTLLISETLQYFLPKFTIFSYIFKSFSFEIFPLHLTILIYLFVKQSVKQLSNYCYQYQTMLMASEHLRGCSYGGELARLGGLARLGEISPTLRNSYKYIMCSYEK